MKKVYTSACVIIPPKEIWDPIQKIRRQYDRQIHRWMPHITLLYPFCPKMEFNDLEKKFINLCSYIKSFEIIFGEFKYFHHRHQNFTIWLNPEPYILINHLQAELLKVVPDCDDVNKHKNGFHAQDRTTSRPGHGQRGSPGSAWLYVILHFLRLRRGCATVTRKVLGNDCPFHR